MTEKLREIKSAIQAAHQYVLEEFVSECTCGGWSGPRFSHDNHVELALEQAFSEHDKAQQEFIDALEEQIRELRGEASLSEAEDDVDDLVPEMDYEPGIDGGYKTYLRVPGLFVTVNPDRSVLLGMIEPRNTPPAITQREIFPALHLVHVVPQSKPEEG